MGGSQDESLEVSRRLGLGEKYAGWLTELTAVGPPENQAPRYSKAETITRLRALGLSAGDAAEAAGYAPSPDRDPELWWLLERCRHLLARGMGSPGPSWRWPALPAELGERGRWFFVHVFLAAEPAVRAWSLARGVPEDVLAATLADLGEKVRLHREIRGVGGFDKQWWLTLHFRGAIHRLGSLQFERVELPPGELPGVEGPVLNLHIPEGAAFDPESCDESLRLARDFYATRFPDWPSRRAVCFSWLLDPQLADHLDQKSNIVRFQNRFQLAPLGDSPTSADNTVLEFVFHTTQPVSDDLPRHTTLQRAIIDHLRAGRHWHSRAGWFPLD